MSSEQFPDPSWAGPVVRLLDADPDLGKFLTGDEYAAAWSLTVPGRIVSRGDVDLDRLLDGSSAFALLIVSGMLLHSFRVGEQPSLRLLGPGDVITRTGRGSPMVLGDSICRAATETTVAILGNELLVGTHRWPRLVPGLSTRIAEQSERLVAQLAVCQLSRVDQRLLAILWLLAESWGHVTPLGTTLPLALTHETLGSLIGARRPTVTLALRDLTERGAVLRQDRGWLLIEGPPHPTGPAPRIEEPALIDTGPSNWAGQESAEPTRPEYSNLVETVRLLREQHVRRRDVVQQRLDELSASRERAAQVRRKLARAGVTPGRRAPSA